MDANDIHIDGHQSRRIRRAFRTLRGAPWIGNFGFANAPRAIPRETRFVSL